MKGQERCGGPAIESRCCGAQITARGSLYRRATHTSRVQDRAAYRLPLAPHVSQFWRA